MNVTAESASFDQTSNATCLQFVELRMCSEATVGLNNPFPRWGTTAASRMRRCSNFPKALREAGKRSQTGSLHACALFDLGDIRPRAKT